MKANFSTVAADFLRAYPRDLTVRWSAEDLRAQREFVEAWLPPEEWLDWSAEAAAFELFQAGLLGVPPTFLRPVSAIVMAGPVAEFLERSWLFDLAATHLTQGGRLIGVAPCLRDNSPENQAFAEACASFFWPYETAEELLEQLRECELIPVPEVTRFVEIPRFKRAVLDGALQFSGFAQAFAQLEKAGYDPMEIGWGELRFVAHV
ncbi:MAG: hypothetical protein AB1813_11095 [Verrucomicrobiota bacterium]